MRAEGSAEGTTDVVVGYRVALKTAQVPKSQDRVRFHGGGQLGRDLSLPRLHELWCEPSIVQADSASAEWQAAYAGGREPLDTLSSRCRLAAAPAPGVVVCPRCAQVRQIV